MKGYQLKNSAATQSLFLPRSGLVLLVETNKSLSLNCHYLTSVDREKDNFHNFIPDFGLRSGHLKGDTTYRITFSSGASEDLFDRSTNGLGL